MCGAVHSINTPHTEVFKLMEEHFEIIELNLAADRHQRESKKHIRVLSSF